MQHFLNKHQTQRSAKQFVNGGMLRGPGTGTSDSIDGQVIETGEPIKVSNGERIVSVAQNQYLEDVAKQMGHFGVDDMLEEGTGMPVGPSVKYVSEDGGEEPGGSIKKAAKKPPKPQKPQKPQKQKTQGRAQRTGRGKNPIRAAADGGMFGSLKRAVGMGDSPELKAYKERSAAELAAKSQTPSPAQTSAPATKPEANTPAPRGSQGVLDARMKAAGAYASGGMVEELNPSAAVAMAPTESPLEKYIAQGNTRNRTYASGGMVSGQGSVHDAIAEQQRVSMRPKSDLEMRQDMTYERAKASDPTLSEAQLGDIITDKEIKGFSQGGQPRGIQEDDSKRITHGKMPNDYSEIPGGPWGAVGMIGKINEEKDVAHRNWLDAKANNADLGFKRGGAIKKMATGGLLRSGVEDPEDAKMKFAKDMLQTLTSQSTSMPSMPSFSSGGKIVRAAAEGKPPEATTRSSRYRSTIDEAVNAAVPAPKPGSDLESKWNGLKAVANDAASLFDLKTGTTGNAMAAEFSRNGVTVPSASAVASDIARISAPSAPPAAPSAASATQGPYPEPVQTRNSVAPVVAPSATPILTAAKRTGTGINDGHGVEVQRIDSPGKSPLFTNLTGAVGDASNERLLNRGAITPQNMAAADNLANKYQREAQNTNQRLANEAQFAQESAQAAAINADNQALNEKLSHQSEMKQKRWAADSKLSSTMAKKEEKAAAMADIASLNARAAADDRSAGEAIRTAATSRTEQNRLDQNASQFQATNRIAQQRQGLDQNADARAAATFGDQRQAKAELDALMQAFNKAGPADKPAIAEQIRLRQGKEQAHKYTAINMPDTEGQNGQVLRGGQIALDHNGRAIDLRPQGGGAKSPYAENTKLTGPDGKSYVVKNGVPVPL